MEEQIEDANRLSESQLHLAFLFSLPLGDYSRKKSSEARRWIHFDKIEYNKEFETMHQGL